MQCMEVWGGNRVVDQGVVMAGLDAWVYSKPYDGADGGGDLHYVSSCATGRITRLLLADVSGHGKAVAQSAVALRDLMRRYVNYIDQTSFVRAMNAHFGEMSQDSMFATAIVTTYFAPASELRLCNAGHPPPLVFRKKTKQWSQVTADPDESDAVVNIPLGVIDGTDYPHYDLRVDVGDMVLCYTDSLIEAQDRKGDMLGPAGLVRIAQGLDTRDPTTWIAQLLEAIKHENPDNLVDDDVTAMLFRPNGMSPKVPFLERAAAPLKVMAASIRSLFPGGGPAPLPEMSLRNLGGGMFDGKPRT